MSEKNSKKKNIDIKCIILGSKNDNKLIKNHNIDKSYIINSCGKYKLSELPNIFQNALFVVTNETCAVHFSRLSGLKNAIVFCNIYYPDTNTVNYFSKPQIKNTEKFLNGKKGNYGYYYLYPKISIDKAVDKTYKPTDEVDLRINQQLDGIKQEHIEAVIDLLIDEISSNKSKK